MKEKNLTLGELIRLTREAMGFTLRDVERESGVSNALVSQIETGWVQDTSLRNAAKLGKVLGLTLVEMAATKVGKPRRR